MIATRVQRVLKIQMAGVLVGVVVIYEPETVSFDLLVVSGNGRAPPRMCSGVSTWQPRGLSACACSPTNSNMLEFRFESQRKVSE